MTFQSTLPVGGATRCTACGEEFCFISIHAPRGGSDPAAITLDLPSAHFNPRSPWGGATKDASLSLLPYAISIHAPRGGSDCVPKIHFSALRISIHAPRGGSDFLQPGFCICHADFNPRSPWGERRHFTPCLAINGIFQSTLPVGVATIPALSVKRVTIDFNPRSPWGERPLSAGIR